MLAKSVFTVTFFALAQFAVATPPGCLLGAINKYPDPSDVKSVCKAKDAATKIASFCGDNTKQALSAFADICNDQGVKISTDVPTSSSGSVKPSGTAPASAYGTGSIGISHSGNSTLTTATGEPPKPSGTAATVGTSGTPTRVIIESTGAAGKLEVGVVAAFAGLMAIGL